VLQQEPAAPQVQEPAVVQQEPELHSVDRPASLDTADTGRGHGFLHGFLHDFLHDFLDSKKQYEDCISVLSTKQ